MTEKALRKVQVTPRKPIILPTSSNMLPLNKRKYIREYVPLGSVSRITPSSRTTGPVLFAEDDNRIDNTGRNEGLATGNSKRLRIVRSRRLGRKTLKHGPFDHYYQRFRRLPSSHNATKVIHNVDPWGLPKKMTLKKYRANPVCHLSAFNYKVKAKVGATRADQKYVLSVVNTSRRPKSNKRRLLSASCTRGYGRQA